MPWVPWRGGHTAREQARRKAIRAARKPKATRGRVSDKAAQERARKAHRKAALKQLRAGKMTPAQYRKRLREIG